MAKLTDTDLMPFGKHQGKVMANVPASYLVWAHGAITRNKKTADVLDYIKDNLDAIYMELKKEEMENLKNAKSF